MFEYQIDSVTGNIGFVSREISLIIFGNLWISNRRNGNID